MNPKKFLAELKRRNVYKAAIAYGIVAWLLMQVITTFRSNRDGQIVATAIAQRFDTFHGDGWKSPSPEKTAVRMRIW